MVAGKGAKGLLTAKSSTAVPASANNGNKSNGNGKADKKKPISRSSRAGLQVSTSFHCFLLLLVLGHSLVESRCMLRLFILVSGMHLFPSL